MTMKNAKIPTQIFSIGRHSTLCAAAIFILGYVIEVSAKVLHISQATGISLILLSTRKNYGLAGVIALTLLSEKAAVPGAVCTVFAILHTVWLGFHYKKTG